MSKVVSPAAVAAGLTELWSPRVVASLDDSYVKVAKVHGTFGWHAHDDEDELFYVLAGHLRIEMADGAVELHPASATIPIATAAITLVCCLRIVLLLFELSCDATCRVRSSRCVSR